MLNRFSWANMCRGLLSIALASALALIAPATALADVRLADVVMGETVEERGLSVSQCPSIDAQFAYVMDTDGNVYFERNSNQETQIASITKVMTAIVALEESTMDTKVVVSEAAAYIGESTAALRQGDVMTMDQALVAMLVSSGNDAALAIAETLGDKWKTADQTAVQAFAAKMNEKASAIGMENSLFENSHGLDFDEFEGNLHSTAHDVALMCAHAMKTQAFRDIVKQPSAVITVTRDGEPTELELESTDKMLDEYEGACGIKTGFTQLAGYSFAGACERNGKTLIAVLINSSTEYQRFADCEKLFDWVFDHEKDYKLITSNQTATMAKNGQEITVPVVASVSHQGWLDKTVLTTVEDPEQMVRVFDLKGNISQEVIFDKVTEDVHVGDKLGTILFKQHNETIATVKMISCENVNAPNMIEGIGIWFKRMWADFSGEKSAADSVLINTTPLLIDRSSL